MSAHFASPQRPHASVSAWLYRAFSLLCLVSILTACTGQATPQTTPASPSTTATPAGVVYNAEVSFEAHLLAPLENGQNMYVEIVDEVTGLALNSLRAKMLKSDTLTYKLKIPFAMGSVVKYRYTRDDPTAPVEYNTQGKQVRYRMHWVDGPGTVFDVVAGWKNAPSKATDFGRIMGHVAMKASSAPVINALVSAGGVSTLTASDGSFVLEGLPVGNHTLVAYALDGAFKPFQQGASVAANSDTPALIQVDPAKTVSITFIASQPAGAVKGLPVRMVGNLLALGNTFADLRGGVSILAARAPLMQQQPDGRYALTLKLPAGTDVRYKYTLGDGFWNAEHRSNGDFQVRQLVVPDRDTTLEESIASWGSAEPISFTVTAPKDTLATDVVSIQFSPYGWTEPVPMWPLGNNRWFYTLYGPLNILKTGAYRYCRNDQCGTADAADTTSDSAKGKPLNVSNKSVTDTISAWAWMETESQAVTVSSGEVKSRSGFVGGVEFPAAYQPGWQPYFPWAFQSAKDIGSNTVLIAPTWHWTNQNPPVLAPVNGQDALWADLVSLSAQARQRSLDVVYHPTTLISGDADAWWQRAARNDNFWQSWFDRYETFLLHHADLAAQTSAKALVIGDETILPALPGGTLADGKPSNVPEDAADRWAKIITDLRAHYKGKLMWMLPMNTSKVNAPAFLAKLDGVYVLASAPITDAAQPSANDLSSAFGKLLDEQILPLSNQGKTIIWIGMEYPSAQGAATGCVKSAGKCAPMSEFTRAAVNLADVKPALNEQAQVYNAALNAIQQRDWITGMVASGFAPAATLKDLSVSVRGKPAADVLWYWYPRLIGK